VHDYPPPLAANPTGVRFQGGISAEVTPNFAGLGFGGTGLYRVIVAVPADMPPGSFYVRLELPNWYSNSVPLVVQSAAPARAEEDRGLLETGLHEDHAQCGGGFEDEFAVALRVGGIVEGD
jgi:hypothetical protein